MSVRLIKVLAVGTFIFVMAASAARSDEAFYASDPGPYKVANVDSVPLAFPDSDRVMEVQVCGP